MREYLAALEESNPSGDDPAEPPDASAGPKNISLTDPAARWTAAPDGPAFYAYSTNYLIDLQAGIIVDVEATPAHRAQEVDSTRKMINRVEERFDFKPARLVGDTAYTHIAPHVPIWDKTGRKDDSLSSSAFERNAQANEYTCPQGHALRSDRRQFKNPRERITMADTVIYRSSQHDCTRVLDEGQVLPEHADSQGRAQHLRELTGRRPVDRHHSAVTQSRRRQTEFFN